MTPDVSSATALEILRKGASEAETERSSERGDLFAELVSNALDRANRDQLEAERQARLLADGKADIVDATVALSKADLSLRFVVSLRNRVLEAYQEIMRLQV